MALLFSVVADESVISTEKASGPPDTWWGLLNVGARSSGTHKEGGNGRPFTQRMLPNASRRCVVWLSLLQQTSAEPCSFIQV